MVPFYHVPALFWKGLNITKFCVNNHPDNFPNLWGLWGASWTPSVVFTSDQCIVLEFKVNNTRFYVAGIYCLLFAYMSPLE
jgi:hypothetical protein